MVSKLSDVSGVVKQAIQDLHRSLPTIMKLATSQDWKEREVAATVLVETSKKKPAEVVAEMIRWVDHPDPNVRRTASEGLRDVARKNPELVLPVIAGLKADTNLYVKKSVANVLRNAGNYHPEFVLNVCAEWAQERNPDTFWIIKDGLKKLKAKYPERVEKILSRL